MFTPVETSLGALLLHEASTAMLQDHGRVLGISGILDGALSGGLLAGGKSAKTGRAAADKTSPRTPSLDDSFRPAFLAGMLLAPTIAGFAGMGKMLPDQGEAVWAGMSTGRLALAGVLVGLGSKLGSGCTSGHMLCGLSRLSRRSITAVATFFPIAMLTAHLVPSTIPFPPPYPSSASLQAHSPGLFPSQPTTAALCIPVLAYPLVRRLLRRYLRTLDPNAAQSHALRHVPYFLIGMVFAMGLLISGMSSPLKVLSFLTFPNWATFDPSLALVMLFAVVPNAVQYLKTRPTAYFTWESWKIPTRRDIDWKLLVGAAVFGIGWGLAGVCPGPAITAAGQVLARSLGTALGPGVSKVPSGDVAKGVITFMGSLAGGMSLARLYLV